MSGQRSKMASLVNYKLRVTLQDGKKKASLPHHHTHLGTGCALRHLKCCDCDPPTRPREGDRALKPRFVDNGFPFRSHARGDHDGL